jgi:hypothetical protein
VSGKDEYLDEICTMIEDCEKRSPKLSDWELNFIDSLNDVLGKGGHITPKQAEKLGEIWERVT